MSQRTRSGRSSRASASPEVPSRATRTWFPIISSSSARLSAAETLSSTTRTRRFETDGTGEMSFRFRASVHEGETDDELRAATRAVAPRVHRAAMKLRQILHQGEPEAEATLAPRQRAVGLDEGLEHAGDGSRLHPDAGVPDRELRLAVVRGEPHGDGASARRELRGVEEEVTEHLRDTGGVPVDAGGASLEEDVEGEAGIAEERAEVVRRACHQVPQVEPLALENHLAARESG